MKGYLFLIFYLFLFPVNCTIDQRQDPINQIWQKIETIIDVSCVEKDLFTFNSGATETEISDFESKIGQTIPPDFKAFLKMVNGQNVYHKGYNQSLISESYLIPLDIMFETWENWNLVIKTYPEFNKNAISLNPEVKNLWWSNGWIPIAMDSFSDGDGFYMDLDPSKNGIKGQIIFFRHDELERIKVANSLKEWLQQFIKDSEDGKYICTPEDGFELIKK